MSADPWILVDGSDTPRTVGEVLAQIAEEYCRRIDQGAMASWFVKAFLFELNDLRILGRALADAVLCQPDGDDPDSVSAPDLNAWQQPFYHWALRFYPRWSETRNRKLAANIVAARTRGFAAALAAAVRPIEHRSFAAAKAPHPPRLGEGLRDPALDLPASGRQPVDLGLMVEEAEVLPPKETLADFVSEAIVSNFARLGASGDAGAYGAAVMRSGISPERVAQALGAAGTFSRPAVPRQWTVLQEIVGDAAFDYGVARFTAEGRDQVEERASIFADVIALRADFAVEACAQRAAAARIGPLWNPWDDLPIRERLARERREQARLRRPLYPC